MHSKPALALLLLSFLALPAWEASAWPQQPPGPTVLLVSFDGFRHDYVEKYRPPNFLRFIREGAAAEYMMPGFPSKTFPNHYSVVTGMYPGTHGLVDNTFIDSLTGAAYTMGKRSMVEDPQYYGGLPLWQLAQRHGLRSASYFWVGSEAPVAGSFPDYYQIYNEQVPNEQRISTVLKWLQLPEKDKPSVITLYFSLVDTEGHRSGPNSRRLRKTVLEADKLLGRLMKQTDALPQPPDIVVVSDHGMYEMTASDSTHIYLQHLFGPDASVPMANSGALVHVYEEDSTKREALYQMLQEKARFFSVYKKEETPEKWHYRNHQRIGEIVLVAKPGHYFKNGGRPFSAPGPTHPWGVHGYDPYITPEMRAIFYARGPHIKTGVRIPPIDIVHVYPFVALLLGLPLPLGIDGRQEVLSAIMAD